MIRALAHAWRAERIKVRRSSFWAMALLFPLATALLPAALFAGRTALPPDTAVTLVEGTLSTWCRAMLGLFSVMVALGSFLPEHTHGMWKHLNALPTRGAAQILAKHLLALAVTVVATVGLVVCSVVAVVLLKLYRPELRLDTLHAHDLRTLAVGAALCLAAGMGTALPTLVVAARAQRSAVGYTLGAGAAAVVLGNGMFPAIPAFALFPWSAGAVWSEVLEHEVTSGAAVAGSVGASVVWAVASVALHIALQRRRPLY